MLYIELAARVSTESEEVAPNIVLDHDENNQVVGIEIENTSTLVDLSRLEISASPHRQPGTPRQAASQRLKITLWHFFEALKLAAQQALLTSGRSPLAQ